MTQRHLRRGCAAGQEARLRFVQGVTLERFRPAQWFTQNIRDRVPGRGYIGLEVLDPALWNVEPGREHMEYLEYMVAVEVATGTQPPEAGVVLALESSGVPTLLRYGQDGYTTMKGEPVASYTVRYVGDVLYQSWRLA